jgi:hypothetical protein
LSQTTTACHHQQQRSQTQCPWFLRSSVHIGGWYSTQYIWYQ